MFDFWFILYFKQICMVVVCDITDVKKYILCKSSIGYKFVFNQFCVKNRG